MLEIAKYLNKAIKKNWQKQEKITLRILEEVIFEVGIANVNREEKMQNIKKVAFMCLLKSPSSTKHQRITCKLSKEVHEN